LMETPDSTFSEFVGMVKSWVARRSEPANVSRDFWMPDHSCRVCYECDSQFTIFNRRHHCRLCGRVFCGTCTANSVPVSTYDPKNVREEGERIRVCNFCFKQWEQEMLAARNGIRTFNEGLSPSVSTMSFASTKSSGTASSSMPGSLSYSTGPYQHGPYGSNPSLVQSAKMGQIPDNHEVRISRRKTDPIPNIGDPSPNEFSFHMNRCVYLHFSFLS